MDGLTLEGVQHQLLTTCRDPGQYFFLEGRRFGRLGACMLTANDKDPLYISIGHRVSLETCIQVVAHCLQNGEREPTPTLHADKIGRERVRQEIEKKKHSRRPRREIQKPSPGSIRRIPIRKPQKPVAWNRSSAVCR